MTDNTEDTDLESSDEVREVKPWDLLNPNNYDSNQAEIDRRFAICQTCEFFTKRQTCAKCGCFMKLKTKLESARCPIRKW